MLTVTGTVCAPPVRSAEELAAQWYRLEAVRTDREIPGDRHSFDATIEVARREVDGSEMCGRPVVPEREAVGLPPEPHGELRSGDLVEEQVEDPAVLAVGEADDVERETRVDEQRAFL